MLLVCGWILYSDPMLYAFFEAVPLNNLMLFLSDFYDFMFFSYVSSSIKGSKCVTQKLKGQQK